MRLSPRSIVPVLDALLAPHREATAKIGSHLLPTSDADPEVQAREYQLWVADPARSWWAILGSNQ